MAAEFLHLRRAGIDVVDVEVRPRAFLARLHIRDRSAAVIADARHEVLARDVARSLLELPPEEPAPELLCFRGVVGRNLDVNHVTGHLLLLAVMLSSQLSPHVR